MLFGGGGLEAVEVGLGEGVEEFGVLAEDDGGIGEDAMFEGVEAGGGFALGGTGSGGFRGVAAVGVNLFERAHDFSGSTVVWGNRGGIGVSGWGVGR